MRSTALCQRAVCVPWLRAAGVQRKTPPPRAGLDRRVSWGRGLEPKGMAVEAVPGRGRIPELDLSGAEQEVSPDLVVDVH